MFTDPKEIEVLDKTKEYILKGWIKRLSAKNKDGWAVHYTDSDAIEFCLGGAVYRAVSDLNLLPSDANSITNRFSMMLKINDPWKEKDYCNYTAFNDDPEVTKEQVLDFIDKAKTLNENYLPGY